MQKRNAEATGIMTGMLIMFLLPASLFAQSDTAQVPTTDTTTVPLKNLLKKKNHL